MNVLLKVLLAPIAGYFFILMLPIQLLLWCVYRTTKLVVDLTSFLPYIIGIGCFVFILAFAAVDKMSLVYFVLLWAFTSVGLILVGLFIAMVCVFIYDGLCDRFES
ncbi:hypothetical protein [Shewanella ulleungensis]|uniref:hypothetical protein n=1 Tax=Shewanella ulleungensis TaxID=2282699 RepID=UPI003D794F51